MADLSTWSSVDASNNAATPDGWPEGQSPSSVNDCGRAMMGAVRRMAEDMEWFNWGHNLVRQSNNSFLVSLTATQIYTAGRRLKMIDGGVTILGEVLASGASGTNTLVTVSSSNLSASLSSGSVSIIDPLNKSIPSPTILRALSWPILISGTEQATTSGTAINFTDIPSWVKKITVVLMGVSTGGTTNFLLQIGDSGGVENAGYLSSSEYAGTAATSTAGFLIRNAGAASAHSGLITLVNTSGNKWVASGVVRANQGGGSGGMLAGDKTLSDTLDRLTLTSTGADTFDAGSINIVYE